MKRFIFSFLLIVVSIVPVFSQSSTSTTNWKKYDDGAYSIKYPNNWEATKRGNQLILMQKRTNDYEFMPSVNIIIAAQKRTESTRYLAEGAYNQVKATGITSGNVSYETITLAGLSGYSWATPVSMQGFRLYDKQYIVKKSDNTTFIVSYMIEESKRSPQLKVINAILSTLIIR